MKQIKMILSVLIVSMLMFSCTRVGVGHVGLKIDQTGDNKGVNPSKYVTGWVFYNPISSDVVEFPTFMQHVEYDEFSINAHGGSQFGIKPYINYVVDAARADSIYMQFKTSDLDDISNKYIRNAVYQSFTDVTGKYSPDDLLKNREVYEKDVFTNLAASLKAKGFILQQVTSNLTPPATLIASIDAKNKSEQDAQAIQLQVAQSIAQANKDVAQAKGDSASMVIRAYGEAKANQLRQNSLNELLIRQQWIEAWREGGSKVPSTVVGSGSSNFLLSSSPSK
jgi:regulator of protease activity HflC (stomatin/prohibitin superfamily)